MARYAPPTYLGGPNTRIEDPAPVEAPALVPESDTSSTDKKADANGVKISELESKVSGMEAQIGMLLTRF